MARVSVFIPNIKGNGSKFCAAMTAFQINKIQPLAKILIIDLNTKSSYFLGHFFHTDEFHTFENFYIQRKVSKNIQEALDSSKIPIKENMDLLKSSTSILGSKITYTPLEALETLNSLEPYYDYILLTTSSDIDPLSIAAISIAEDIFLVLNDNIENYINSKWKIEEISTLRKMEANSYVIFNKYSNNLPSPEFGHFLKELEFKTIAIIPFSPRYVDNKNIFKLYGKKTDVKKGNVKIAEIREFNKRELEKIEIRERLGISTDEKISKTKKMLSEKSIRILNNSPKDGVRECFRFIYDEVYLTDKENSEDIEINNDEKSKKSILSIFRKGEKKEKLQKKEKKEKKENRFSFKKKRHEKPKDDCLEHEEEQSKKLNVTPKTSSLENEESSIKEEPLKLAPILLNEEITIVDDSEDRGVVKINIHSDDSTKIEAKYEFKDEDEIELITPSTLNKNKNKNK